MSRLRILPRLALTCVALLLAPAPPLRATLTDVTPTDNPWVTSSDEDFWVEAAAPADVDGDGDVDIAMLGYYVVYNVSAEHRLSIFFNDGPDVTGHWTFTQVPQPLGDLYSNAPDLAWQDVDADGDPDLAVGTGGSLALFRNDGGTLVQTDTVLPGYSEDAAGTSAFDLRSITWADFDNDGDPDLLVPSVLDPVDYAYSTQLLRNDGSNGTGGWIFTDLGAAIDGALHAQSGWADDDSDLDLDLFLAEMDNVMDGGFIRRFRNDGGVFVGEELLPIAMHLGTVDRGDYDCDGDLDVVVAGNFQEADGTYATALRIYRNDSGSYAPIELPGNWLDYNAATWADHDGDGDTDLLVNGSFVGPTEIEGKTTVYANDAGVFTDTGLNLPSPFSSIGGGGASSWFDLDGDGDLDYLQIGGWYVPGGNGLVETRLQLFRNDPSGSNFAPPSPGNLRAAPSGSGVTLAWDPPADDHTPGAGLTYELRVRPSGGSASLERRVPEPGNVGGATSWRLSDLPDGSYEWSVCAVDNALAGGAPSASTFVIGSGALIPPAVGDGIRTLPFLVTKAGSALTLSWDAVTCPAAAYVLLHGFGTQLPSVPGGSFGLAGSECGVASPHSWSSSPSPSSDRTSLLWMLVVATDGVTTEGSWGLDSQGRERVGSGPDGSSGHCGVTARSLASTCGR